MMDHEHFSQRAAHMEPQLRRMLKRSMGDHLRAFESVSDLIQSVFRTLWIRRDRIPPGDREFVGYAFCVAKNKAVDHGRYYSVPARKKTLCANHEQVRQVSDRSLTAPDHRLREAEFARHLGDAMKKLSASDTKIIIASLCRGATIADLAALLGTSEKTASVRLCRARARLAEILIEVCPEYRTRLVSSES